MTRRSFFQSITGVLGLAILLPIVARAERKRGGGAAAAAGAVALVNPQDAQAKAVNYVAKTADIKDKSLQLERAGVAFKDQHCSNCAFYDAKKETTVGGVKAGPCSMPFAAGKVVAKDGWCSTWAKKS